MVVGAWLSQWDKMVYTRATLFLSKLKKKQEQMNLDLWPREKAINIYKTTKCHTMPQKDSQEHTKQQRNSLCEPYDL